MSLHPPTTILNLKCCYCGVPIHFSRQACQECIVGFIVPQMQKEAKERAVQQEIKNKVIEKQAKELPTNLNKLLKK